MPNRRAEARPIPISNKMCKLDLQIVLDDEIRQVTQHAEIITVWFKNGLLPYAFSMTIFSER